MRRRRAAPYHTRLFRTRFELKDFLKLKEILKSFLSFEKRCVREHQPSAAADLVPPPQPLLVGEAPQNLG
jgi:hypothetical protein